MSTTVHTGSGVQSVALGCHTYNVSKPGRRVKANAQFGKNGTRTLGVINVADCARCIAFFTTPPNNKDFPTNPDLAPLDADEIQFRDGTLLQGRAVISNALDALRNIQQAESF